MLLFAGVLNQICDSLQKLSLLTHLGLREKLIESIQAAVVLLCWTLAMPDLQYN